VGVVCRRNFPPTDVEIVPETHTRSDSVGKTFSFPGREADCSHSSVVQLRMCGAIPLFPYTFLCSTPEQFTFRIQEINIACLFKAVVNLLNFGKAFVPH
jgi:hypothetical protein